MSNEIRTVIECPFQLVGTYALTVGGGTVNIAAGAGTWYRHALARGSDTGTTVLTPRSFSSYLDTQLGADFTVEIPTAEGYYSIKYTGASPPVTIDWSSGAALIIRDLCGYTGNLTFTATNQSIAATKIPPYRICSYARVDDTEVQARSAGSAVSRDEQGRVTGFRSSAVLLERSFVLDLVPRDPTIKTARNSLASPMFPDRTGSTRSRLQYPTEQLPNNQPTSPMSLHELWAYALNRPLACVLGWWKELRAGAALYFDEADLSEETAARNEPLEKLRDVRWNAMARFPVKLSITEMGVSL